MFLARAQQSQSSFVLNDESMAKIIQICHLVDGLPLAIELAAASLRGVSLEYLAQELQAGLDILTTSLRDLPEQHRNLRATFDPLWAMLSEREQQICEKLSVFQSGFTLEAAQAVAGANLAQLSGLVDKSVLSQRTPGKYTLHPLLRHYAAEKLAENPLEKEQTRAKAEQQLSQRLTRDAITNLPNKDVFWDRLEHTLGRAQRKRQFTALILLDVEISGRGAATGATLETASETASDSVSETARKTQALQEAARRLVRCLRRVDTVTRLTGQRFAIILDEISSAQDGALVVGKVLEALKSPIEVEGETYAIEAQAGLAVFPEDGTDQEALVRMAEAELAQVKWKV
jgi:GGDEF domain-containing protein